MSSLISLARSKTITLRLFSPSAHQQLIYLPSHRHAMMSAMSTPSGSHIPSSSSSSTSPSSATTSPEGEDPKITTTTTTKPPSAKELDPDAGAPQVAARPPPLPKAERPRPVIRASKAAITITPTAIERLQALLKSPTPQLLRIGVRNKGCAGLSYHLEYVDKPAKFDEVVEQDGVKVVIDSKALFSIIGSEMDWKEDTLSAKFAFKNPNIKDACGCGESFTVGG